MSPPPPRSTLFPYTTLFRSERLRVPHPDFILVSPRGAWVIVTDEREHPRHISSVLLEEVAPVRKTRQRKRTRRSRSEEHTSELQSRQYLVCRLLLEKKKKKI